MSLVACLLSSPRRSSRPRGLTSSRHAIAVLASLLLAARSPAATDMRFCDPLFWLQAPATPLAFPEHDSAGVLVRSWPRPDPEPALASMTARVSATGAPSADWHR